MPKKKIKKIKVSKSDEPTVIAEKLIDTEETNVIFQIPKFSRFGESISNFKLIAREAEVLKKNVVIESVDDDVLEYAEKSGLEAVNPFIEERKKRFSDIVGPGSKKKKAAKAAKATKAKKKEEEEELEVEEEEEVIEEDVQDEDYELDLEDEDEEEIEDELEEELGMDDEDEDEDDEEEDEDEDDPAMFGAARSVGEPRRTRTRRPKSKSRRIAAAAITTVVVAGAAYLGLGVLPKAEATLIMRKEPWSYNGNVMVDREASEVNKTTGEIPGQVFTKQKSEIFEFPANGRNFVERKARGEITIYNAYSSKSQQLVVNTRFLTPDNKLFRLTEGVTVPGAEISDGEITPASITVDVIADEAGEEFNVGPVERLSIPGFQGTPRYSGFYGELKEGTSRGFIGEAQVPTETDLNKAKAQSLASLESDLRDQLRGQLPEGFRLLEDAAKFTITKQYVDSSADANGNFRVEVEGELTALTFKEQNVIDVITEKLFQEKGDGYVVTMEDIIYPDFTLDNPAGGEMRLPVTYQAELARAVDEAGLKDAMRGQSEEELKTTVLAVPGIENAKITLWPFWVRKVPNNLGKISITIE